MVLLLLVSNNHCLFYCTAMNDEEKNGLFSKYSIKIDVLAHGAWPATLLKISQLEKKAKNI